MGGRSGGVMITLLSSLPSISSPRPIQSDDDGDDQDESSERKPRRHRSRPPSQEIENRSRHPDHRLVIHPSSSTSIPARDRGSQNQLEALSTTTVNVFKLPLDYRPQDSHSHPISSRLLQSLKGLLPPPDLIPHQLEPPFDPSHPPHDLLHPIPSNPTELPTPPPSSSSSSSSPSNQFIHPHPSSPPSSHHPQQPRPIQYPPQSESDRPNSKSFLISEQRERFHRIIPNLPVNSKSPIPSFYEYVNGKWVLSDNWNLYGLSGSSSRHRARSLDELSSAPPSDPSSSHLAHHASAVPSSPILQYDTTLSNSSSSSSNNAQKLYLPTGWNHTSQRGPLYATSVIVVASLVIAVGVLSTVVFLVARRRDRNRKANLQSRSSTHSTISTTQATHPSSAPFPDKQTLEEIEEGRVKRARHRLRSRLNRRLQQLTLVKINRFTNGRSRARISRVTVTTHPNDPPPPSLIVVGEVRRSTSSNSPLSGCLNPGRQNLSRRSLRSDHAADPQTFFDNTNPTQASGPEGGNGHSIIDPSSHPSTPSAIPLPSVPQPIPIQSLPDINDLGLPSSSNDPQYQLDFHPGSFDYEDGLPDLVSEPGPSMISPPSGSSDSPPDPDHSSLNRPFIPLTAIQSNSSPHHHTDHPSATTIRRELSRVSVNPNYRSYREIIRARAISTISPAFDSAQPSSLAHSGSLSSLPRLSSGSSDHLSHRPSPLDSVDPAIARSQAGVFRSPSNYSNRTVMAEGLTDHHPAAEQVRYQSVIGHILRHSPSPPAYSSQSMTLRPTTRANEKQRMIDEDLEEAVNSTGHPSFRSPPEGCAIGDNFHSDLPTPYVAHVATDDKLILGSLLAMGSSPGDGNQQTQGEKDSRLAEGIGVENARVLGEADVDLVDVVPSAPPLHFEDQGRFELLSDGRRANDDLKTRENNRSVRGHISLDDEQVGRKDLNVLPAPSAQFIIRFDPQLDSTAVVLGSPPDATIPSTTALCSGKTRARDSNDLLTTTYNGYHHQYDDDDRRQYRHPNPLFNPISQCLPDLHAAASAPPLMSAENEDDDQHEDRGMNNMWSTRLGGESSSAGDNRMINPTAPPYVE